MGKIADLTRSEVRKVTVTRRKNTRKKEGNPRGVGKTKKDLGKNSHKRHQLETVAKREEREIFYFF